MRRLIVLVVLISLFLISCSSKVNNNVTGLTTNQQNVLNENQVETVDKSTTVENDFYSDAFYHENDIDYLLNKMKDDEFTGLISDEDYNNIPNELINEMADNMLKNNIYSYISGKMLISEKSEDYQSILDGIDFTGLTGYNDRLNDLDNYSDIYKVDLDSDSIDEFIFFTPMKTGNLNLEAAIFIKVVNGGYKIVDLITFIFYEDILLFEDEGEVYLIEQTDGYIYSTLGTMFITKISNNEQLLNSEYNIKKDIFDLDYISLNLNNIDVNLEILYNDEKNEECLAIKDYINDISFDLMNTPHFFYGDEIPTYDEYLDSLSCFGLDTSSCISELICKFDINNDGENEFIKKMEKNKKFGVEFFSLGEDGQLSCLDVPYKYPNTFQLKQQWFKKFNDQNHTFSLYRINDYYILVCTIMKGDKEEYIVSALLDFRRNIVVETNNNMITPLSRMSPYISRGYKIVNNDYARNDIIDHEVIFEENNELDDLLGDTLSSEIKTAVASGKISEIINKYQILDVITDERFLEIYSEHKMEERENDSIAEIAVQEIKSGYSNHELYISDIFYFDINNDGGNELIINYELQGTGHYSGTIVLRLRNSEWHYVDLDRKINSVIKNGNKMYFVSTESNYNLKTTVGLILFELDSDMRISEIPIIIEYTDFVLEERYFNSDYEKNSKVIEYINTKALEVAEGTNRMLAQEKYSSYYDVFVDSGESLAKDELARVISSTFFTDYYDTTGEHELYKVDLNNDGIKDYVNLRISSGGDNYPAHMEIEEYYEIGNRFYHGDFLTNMSLQVWFKRIDNVTYTFTLCFDYESDNYILKVFDIQGVEVNVVGEYIVSPLAARIM